jgi:hypothetical protein
MLNAMIYCYYHPSPTYEIIERDELDQDHRVILAHIVATRSEDCGLP